MNGPPASAEAGTYPLFALFESSKPGVRRDGTDLDNPYYQDAQHVRFQRGRPRKMLGYRAMSTLLNGPVRHLYTDSRNGITTAHCFSQYGIEQLSFDLVTGAGAGIVDRTPGAFAADARVVWEADALFSGGGGNTVLTAIPTYDILDLANDTAGALYAAQIDASSALAAIDDGTNPVTASGGVVALQPFLVVYGSNGLIRNSNPNNITGAGGWVGTSANTANVAATKVVQGLPLRGGGTAPAGLFWALDSLIRMTFVGGTKIWQFDTVSADTTILSKKAVVEYDGIYFWAGVDRFYVYNGVVSELPNDNNLDYFFNNITPGHEAKVWAMKVPRFGEIWWFFPAFGSTECNAAVIYNIRQNIWYDTMMTRSAGAAARVFKYPVMAGGEVQSTTRLKFTAGAGTFSFGDTVTGGTSGATGQIVKLMTGVMWLTPTTGTFQNAEGISNAGAAATGTVSAVPAAVELDPVWQHETGTDRIVNNQVTAIDSYLETSSFQFADGGPMKEQPSGVNTSTRVARFEPDFMMTGTMTLQIRGRKYAQSATVDSTPVAFTSATDHVDIREQRRQMSVKLRSNVAGGYWEMGKPLLHIQEGDERP